MADFPAASAARMTDGVKIYGEGDAAVHALDGITAGFEQSHFTAIMGPSGSGKSTLLHCLAGLDNLSSGQVYLGDTELGSLKDNALTKLRREQVGFVFQAFNLIPTLNAQENILLPLSIAGKKPDQDWYDQVVSAVGLQDRLTHRPNELSGGQQQRVAAARALVTSRRSSSPTSRPATWTPWQAPNSSHSCAVPSTNWDRRSSWSRTTRYRRATRIASSSSMTANASTR
jgi:putative ABC transport system ATP-binding protein